MEQSRLGARAGVVAEVEIGIEERLGEESWVGKQEVVGDRGCLLWVEEAVLFS